MLVAKIFVNERQIDEIHIHNLGEIGRGYYQYAIEKPRVKDIKLTHRRSDGYKPLLTIALKLLKEIEDDKCQPK